MLPTLNMTKNTSKTIFSFLVLGILVQSFFYVRNTNAQESQPLLQSPENPANEESEVVTQDESTEPIVITPEENPTLETPIPDSEEVLPPPPSNEEPAVPQEIIPVAQEIQIETPNLYGPTKEYIPRGKTKKNPAPIQLSKNRAKNNENYILENNAPVSHSCSTSPFMVNMKGSTYKESSVKIKMSETGTGKIVLGDTPYGFNVSLQESIVSTSTKDLPFIVKITKQSNPQKGSFVVPVFFETKNQVGEKSIAYCQIVIQN
jgi:hypothetical protein